MNNQEDQDKRIRRDKLNALAGGQKPTLDEVKGDEERRKKEEKKEEVVTGAAAKLGDDPAMILAQELRGVMKVLDAQRAEFVAMTALIRGFHDRLENIEKFILEIKQQQGATSRAGAAFASSASGSAANFDLEEPPM